MNALDYFAHRKPRRLVRFRTLVACVGVVFCLTLLVVMSRQRLLYWYIYAGGDVSLRTFEKLSPSLVSNDVERLAPVNPEIAVKLIRNRGVRHDDMLAIANACSFGRIKQAQNRFSELFYLWPMFDNRPHVWQGSPEHLAARNAFRGLSGTCSTNQVLHLVVADFLNSEGRLPFREADLNAATTVQAVRAIFEDEWKHTDRWLRPPSTATKSGAVLPPPQPDVP